ncbi:hypothetical protein [Corynebacterium cystitidis]|uniref:hypothetical protein n=1 Tax=Corynebacterium cystitidis TaxID=35757 RepID=UPI00211E1A36|nr:hypothetical protein [Corynebacterium cystitidis]
MSAQNSVSDIKAESFPEYSGGRLHDSYIDGYDPVSLVAPHSSLIRTSTWLGAGLVMAGIAATGILIYGVATSIWGVGSADDYSQPLIIIGAIVAAVFYIAGFGLIWYGRRYYRQYREETGRKN